MESKTNISPTETRNSEDNLSLKSSDSQTTSGEYEIVPVLQKQPAKKVPPTNEVTSPVLDMPNRDSMDDLEKNLTEVIFEQEVSENDKSSGATPTTTKNITFPLSEMEKPTVLYEVDLKATTPTSNVVMSPASSALLTPDVNKVGQSVFYDCLDMSPLTEKQDKPEKSDTEEEMSDIDQECTVFSGVTYLGAANINSPKAEPEIHRTMSELNAISGLAGLKVSVSIPTCSEGLVVLYDAETNAVVSHYEVSRILYYTNGLNSTSIQACFAFTWSHGESAGSSIFQCHVFRCSIPEAVTQVSSCFIRAFQRLPQQSSMTGSITSAVDNNSLMMASITSDITGNPLSTAMYEFNVSLEIREKVTKNTYAAVPRDRACFKLRCNTDKEVCIVVKQVQSDILPPLFIERCFGVLLAPGRLVRQADMQLLDMSTMGYVKTTADSSTASASSPQPVLLTPQHQATQHAAYQIRAEWKASEKAFGQLNLESQKMFLTVAVDLVIKGIQEPVRFVIETQVTILSQNELRIMDNLFLHKRPMMLKFYLQLKESGEGTWEVQSIDHSDEITEPTQASLLNLKIKTLTKMVRSSSVVSIEFDDLSPTDYSSDGDEPMLSGTGEVSKDCSQDRLEEWSTILQEWDATGRRPKSLHHYVRLGIPEALRCKVWQKLANVEQKTEMSDRYRVLITKETNCESVILRDINRTFPAHKFFKETGGSGQDGLYKVSKAYAVYDSEVGYCQGLSFIAASLLLHMPEEEAFCCLVALMYDYGLRDMYKMGFESLYLRLYQLNRLMKDQLPDLYEHFQKMGVETHMFASQWFLTLFTARFPLFFVYHILDVFLLDGLHTLFQVGMTLLYVCKKELLELDFEGILKYFRVMVPKKCRNEVQAKKLMKLACEWKIKKLKKYEDDYKIKKDEQERIELAAKQYELRFNEEKKVLLGEITHLHEKLGKASLGEQTSASIIADYKQIIQRHEQQIGKLNEMLEEITKTVANCTKCASSIPKSSPLHKSFSNLSPAHTTNQQNPTTDSGGLGPLDPLFIAQQRIRELELELARTKLEKVQAECHNQDLNHQLNTTMTEIQNRNNTNSWQPPWFSKTLNSIQEKVVTRQRDTPTFQSYTTTTAQTEDGPKVKTLPQTNSQKYLQHRHSLTATTASKFEFPVKNPPTNTDKNKRTDFFK